MIELLVVVTITAILASIAFPSYQGSVEKSRRSDAQAALVGFSNAMERFFTQNYTYVGTSSTVPGAPISSLYPNEVPLSGNTKYYDLVVQSAAADTFTLRAIPKGAQASDGYLELTYTAEQRWDANDNSTIDAGEHSW